MKLVLAALVLLPLSAMADSAPDLSAIMGRDTTAPLESFEDCVRGADARLSAGPALSPGLGVEQFCHDKFVAADADAASQLFASSNVLVGYDSARARHNAVGRLFLAQDTVANETAGIAQESANAEALRSCETYKIRHDLAAMKCRVVATFEPQSESPAPKYSIPFEGGYWARSLVLLSK